MSDTAGMASVADIIQELGGPSQAAEKVGASRAAVYDWLASGKFPSGRLLALHAAGVPMDDLLPLITTTNGRAA